MKTTRIMVRTLLLIWLICPSGLRAFGSRVGSHSCRIPSHVSSPARHRSAGRSNRTASLTTTAERAPTQRLHRVRGKRVHLDASLLLTHKQRPIGTLPFSAITLHAQNLNGPNPPRGPPALSV